MQNTSKRYLSPHFTLYEMTASRTAIEQGIKNKPNAAQVAALTALCVSVLEPLRAIFGPIIISSGYRCARLNRLVGGKPTSQHIKGEAADILISDSVQADRLYRYIIRRLDFDQLILEPVDADKPRWIHVSYTTKRRNRHMVV